MQQYLIPLFTICLILFVHISGVAQRPSAQTPFYDDPKVIRWSKDFLAGQREQVLKSVERDLKSASPHPLAPHIWTTTQFYLDRLQQSWKGLQDPALRHALGIMPDVFQLYLDGEYKELLRRFPAIRAGEIGDPWALHYLFFAADYECRYEDALAFATQMARLRPDYFQSGWMISSNLIMKEKIRPRVAALVTPGSELASTPVGRFLRNELQHLPTTAKDDKNDLEQINAWLQERPRDPRALRRRAFTLIDLGQYEEALAAFSQATEAYPFISNYQEAAAQLILLDREKQADALIVFNARLRTANPQLAANQVEERKAQALIDAGKIEEAIRSLDAALARRPQSAELASLRATAANEAGDWLGTVKYRRLAAMLNSSNFELQVELIRSLVNARQPNEAFVKYLEVDQKHSQKSQYFYWLGSQALGETLDITERVQLCQRAVAEYPESVWLRRERAVALATSNQYAEALRSIHDSYDIEAPNEWALKFLKHLVMRLNGNEGFAKEKQALQLRFPWVVWPAPKAGGKDEEEYDEFLDTAKLSKAFSALGGLDGAKLISTPARTVNRVSYVPFLRVQLESLAEINVLGDYSKGLLAFNPNEDQIVKAGNKGALLFWDMASGKVTHSVTEHQKEVTVIRFARRNGDIFASGSKDGTIKLWNLGSRSVFRTFGGFTGEPISIEFDPSGDRMFAVWVPENHSVGGWYQISCWDVNSGALVWTQKHVYESFLQSLDIKVSQDGQLIAIQNAYQSAKLYDGGTGRYLSALDARELGFRSDGKLVFISFLKHEFGVYRLAGATLNAESRSSLGELGKVIDVSLSREATISPDGNKLLLEDSTGSLKVIDTATGKLVRSWPKPYTLKLKKALWSPDSEHVLTDFEETKPRAPSARPVQRDRTISVTSMLLSLSSATPLWQERNVPEVDDWTGDESYPITVLANVAEKGEFSPSGHYFILNGQVRESFSGKIVSRTGGSPSPIYFVAVSPNGRYLWPVHDYNDGKTENNSVYGARYGAFDIAQSQQMPFPYNKSLHNKRVAIDAQNRLILTADDDYDKAQNLFQVQPSLSTQPVTLFGNRFRESGKGRAQNREYWALSPDGTIVLTSEGSKIIAWDMVGELKPLWTLETGEPVINFALSPDNQRLAVGAQDIDGSNFKYTGEKISNVVSLSIWNIRTHTKEKTLYEYPIPENPEGHSIEKAKEISDRIIYDMSFSPDGKLLGCLTGMPERLDTRVGRSGVYLGDRRQLEVWDTAAGRSLFTTRERPRANVFAFSSDSQYAVTISRTEQACLWRVADGKLMHQLPGTQGATDIKLAPDGKTFLIVRNEEGEGDRIELWDAMVGQKRGSLFLFQDSSWVVIDGEGRFDASNGGDNSNLYWVVGTEPIALNQLKERYYDPGLLAKLLGSNNKPMRDVSALKSVALFPTVTFQPLAPNSAKLTLTLTNRGGGIGQVEVFINGKEITADAREPQTDPKSEKVTLTVDLRGASVKPGEENRVKVVAWNAEGYLKSRDVEVEWVAPGTRDATPPELYAIVGGVSEYEGGSLKLNYAAKDAADMARAMELGGKSLFGQERVHVTLLTTGSDTRAQKPTKTNFRAAFEAAARAAKPNDIFVVYLAGHGVTLQQDKDTYAYLTQEARTGDRAALSDPGVRSQTTITSEELVEWVKKVPALKQVMMLDTCAAGAAAARLIDRREMDSNQIRAFDRLKDRTGFHVLMGSAADAVSYEASRYGQGLLTYALLQGMKGMALQEDGTVEVSRLFQYVADEVPRLAANVGGVQRPTIAAPLGDSFPLARFTKEERQKIKLSVEKPLILQPTLLNVRGRDDLSLMAALRKQLDEERYAVVRGGETRYVYVPVDDEEYPGAITPSGIYTVEGDSIKVNLYLIRDKKEVAAFQVAGTTRDLAGLVREIIRTMAEAVGTLPQPTT